MGKEFKEEEIEEFWRKDMKPEWVVKEEEDRKKWEEEERSKPKEEQEWYQKWLRKQENNPKIWTTEWKDDQPIDPNEKRRNPEDKEYYTFEETKSKYAKEFKDEEIESFWRKDMKPEWLVKEEEDRKAWEAAEAA